MNIEPVIELARQDEPLWALFEAWLDRPDLAPEDRAWLQEGIEQLGQIGRDDTLARLTLRGAQKFGVPALLDPITKDSDA